MRRLVSWYRLRLFGVLVVAILVVMIVVMTLTHDRRTPGDIDPKEAVQISALATDRLATLQLITLLIGVPSLGLLGWTLVETRRSVAAAIRSAEAAESAERAYVFVQTKVIPSGPDTKIPETKFAYYKIKFYVVNLGKTPAIEVEYRFEPAEHTAEDPTEPYDPRFASGAIAVLGTEADQLVEVLRLPDAPYRTFLSIDSTKVRASIRYSDVIGRTWSSSMLISVALVPRAWEAGRGKFGAVETDLMRGREEEGIKLHENPKYHEFLSFHTGISAVISDYKIEEEK